MKNGNSEIYLKLAPNVPIAVQIRPTDNGHCSFIVNTHWGTIGSVVTSAQLLSFVQQLHQQVEELVGETTIVSHALTDLN